MGSDWQETCLGDLISIKHGYAFKGGDFSEDIKNGPIVVTIGNFDYTGGFRFNSTKLKRCNAAFPLEYVAKAGDILLVMTCQTAGGEILGVPGVIPNDNEIYLHNQRLGKVIYKSDSIDSKFLYWLFLTREFNHHLYTTATGTKILHTAPKRIESYFFNVPLLAEQKAIARILDSLDDKIELNRQMNETLESIAQVLFKSWFVDFDLVIDNALVAGNNIPDVFTERAAQRREINAYADKTNKSKGVLFNSLEGSHKSLFPDEFVFTEKMGWIPKGWGVKRVNDLVNTVSETYPLKTVDQVVFLNTGDIQDGCFLHQNYSDAKGLPGQAKKSIKAGDILYSEIRPKNKRYAYVDFDTSDYVVSTKLMVLRSTGEVKSLFTYFVLTQEDKVSYLQTMAESRSGTFPQITFDVLSKIILTLPIKPDLIDRFMLEVLEPNLHKISQNRINSANLEKLRDTLLPKLLSGELRIPDAEKLIDEIKP